MTNVIPFKQCMSPKEYIDALNTVERLVEEKQPRLLTTVRPLLIEMRFCAKFSLKFREETSTALRELVKNLQTIA